MLEQAANLSSSPVGRALQHIQAHHAYKKDNERGWIAICKKLVEPDIGADLRPRFFKTRHHLLNKITEDVIAEHMDGNLYMSQNTFWIPHRKVDNIRQLRALYVDLDCYNMGIEPKQASAMLKPLIKQGAFPMPNRITFSGQGLVLTWDIEPAAYRELPLWQTLIHYLVNVLKPYGSDVHATDAARVFRVDGSTNYKNDSQVQVEYVHSQRQTLQWWQERYLPTLPSTIAAPKKEKKAASNKGTTAKAVISNKKTTAKAVGFYNVYKLHFDRKNDLLKLIEMRNGDMPQCREYALFLYRYWDCDFTKDPEVALENTLELNTRLNPPLTEREVLISTLSAEKAWLKKLDAKEREKARLILNVLPNGMELRYPDAGYNYSNAKLIEILHITSEEQRHLSTIIGKAEKSRRATEKRREKGIQTRKSYLQEQHGKTTDKLDQLREALLKNPLASGDELAEMLGVTKPRISQLRNKL